MNPFRIERLVYNDSDPSDDWVVTQIGHTKIDCTKLRTVNVSSMHEFEAGCKLHENCLGHMGRSPSGMLLPVQSLSVHNTQMSNSVYDAVAALFAGSAEFNKRRYMEFMHDSMLRKTGRMRKGILNCHVDGSLRMVITPQWDFDRNVIAVPWYIEGKWKVCRFNESSNKYETLPVRSGDRAIVVRPPSLQASSVQPMIIQFWPHTCLGISPEILKAFQGDYDGDEMHVNPVYSTGAMEECKLWINTPNKKIEKAISLYANSSIEPKDIRRGYHMVHTTLSFKQIAKGSLQPVMAEETRVQLDHMESVRNRMINPETFRVIFDRESIRGMGDINRQQLSQPIVGDMSRIARIAASCVLQRTDGTIGVYTASGFHPVLRDEPDISAGNSAVRGVSTICAAAQQVALDSHRVQKELMPTHDMISDLIMGSEYTMVVVSKSSDIRQYILSSNIRWRYSKDNLHYILCKANSTSFGNPDDIVAAYNPSILARIKSGKRYSVCRAGIQLVSAYYGISLSHAELSSLAVLYSYRPEAHRLPITSRQGIQFRELQWIESMMAQHYTSLVNNVNRNSIKPSSIRTVSACLMGANFLESLRL